MTQCLGCKTQKKADNCIKCARNAYGLFKKVLIDFFNILESPIHDWKKVDQMKTELGKYLVKKKLDTEGTDNAITD